ncbi:MAG: isoprenylcysteine carboxylmethyltransferase family protein [Deltaproteobacteria bacterium]|nr:isoprenylcysteine carboxylmethyltransferase family protein [Deltaproteobacteria bacterium]
MVGVVVAMVFALGWLPLHFFRAEAVAEALPFYDRRERWWVRFSVTIISLHVSAACVTLSWLPVVPLGRAVLGLTVFGAAIAFWFWGRVQIGPLRRTRLPDEPPHRLRRDGAFGIVRHPLYFSYLLAAAAPLAIVPRAPFLLTFALCCTALAMRAAQEEHRLRAQLGTPYEAYCREVKRLIPFVW